MNSGTLVKLVFIVLVFLMLAGFAAAQNDQADKTITAVTICSNPCFGSPCDMDPIRVIWQAPDKSPDRYRIAWTLSGRNFPKKDAGIGSANGIATTTETTYEIPAILAVPRRKFVQIRIRAVYDDEKNGPWLRDRSYAAHKREEPWSEREDWAATMEKWGWTAEGSPTLRARCPGYEFKF